MLVLRNCAVSKNKSAGCEMSLRQDQDPQRFSQDTPIQDTIDLFFLSNVTLQKLN